MFGIALKRFLDKWKSYKYRFVPWVALNLSKNEKTLRQVTERSTDKLAPDEEVSRALLQLFGVLFQTHWSKDQVPRREHAHFKRSTGRDDRCQRGPVCGHEAMFQTLGFCIDRKPSSLPFAGTGVFVTKGFVPKGGIVALYPGTVYQAYEPIFFQSIRNPFVFRCIDGILIDGNDKGISRMVFRSCSGRDRVGFFRMSDISWLTNDPLNPLAVGQYVNNCSNERPANVCYQEYDVPDTFPIELRQFLPNVNFSQDARGPLRCVVLISLRDITAGEELFSNYYTIVH